MEIILNPPFDRVPEKSIPDIDKEILEFFGHSAQKLKAIEELSELITELSRSDLKRKSVNLKVCEEIADVENILRQIRLIFDNNGFVHKYKFEKLDRTYALVKKNTNLF